MSIISYIALNGSSRDANDSFSDRLACGKSWEHSLTEYLKTQGLDKVQHLDQYIPFKAVWGNRRRPEPADWRDREQSELPRHLQAKFQRDVRVIHNGRGYNLEVKTKAGIFDNPNILGGAVHRWDAYKFPVHYVVAIDRNTGETRVADADPMIRDAEWLKVKAKEVSCGIPRHLFTPLDAWVDFIKG